MKKKKFLAVLLTGVMSMSLLAGCGSKPTLKDAKNFNELCQAQAEATKKNLGIKASGTIYTLKDNSNNSATLKVLVSKPDLNPKKKKSEEQTVTQTKNNIYLEYQPTQSLSSDGAVIIKSFIEEGDKMYTNISGDILSAMFNSSSNISEDSNGVQVKKATLFNNSDNTSTTNSTNAQLNISELTQNPEKLYDAITAGQIWLSMSNDDIQLLEDDNKDSQKSLEFIQRQLSNFTPEELASYITGFENTGEYEYQFHFNMKNFMNDLNNGTISNTDVNSEETTEQSSVSNSILNAENEDTISEITTESSTEENSIQKENETSTENIEEESNTLDESNVDENSSNTLPEKEAEASDELITVNPEDTDDENISEFIPANGARDINDDSLISEDVVETSLLDSNEGSLENVTDIFITLSATDNGIEKIKIDTDLDNNEQITGNFTISYAKEGLAQKPDMPNIIKLSDLITIFKSMLMQNKIK